MREKIETKNGLIDLINYVYNFLNHKMTIVEIGSFKGESAQIMLDTNKVDKIYCVDIWENNTAAVVNETKFFFSKMDKIEKIFNNRFKNDKRVLKFKGNIDQFILKYPDVNNIDLVYVDAIHLYKDALHDIKISADNIKPIFMSGHDYDRLIDYGGVIKAVCELYGNPDKVFQDASWVKKI